MFPGEPHSELP
ncbi:hypothetical protein A2U01_0101757, partial [Trifolium medium]|nr:hypothetical protein [Trifolium medium]